MPALHCFQPTPSDLRLHARHVQNNRANRICVWSPFWIERTATLECLRAPEPWLVAHRSMGFVSILLSLRDSANWFVAQKRCLINCEDCNVCAPAHVPSSLLYRHVPLLALFIIVVVVSFIARAFLLLCSLFCHELLQRFLSQTSCVTPFKLTHFLFVSHLFVLRLRVTWIAHPDSL